MTGRRVVHLSLINAEIRLTLLLTLALFLSLASPFSHADPMPQADADEAKRRINEVTTYIRKESLQGMSLLPGEAREAIGWFSGNWHAMKIGGDDTATAGDLPQNSDGAPRALQEDGAPPIGLSSNFHHKGFLPTHDAFMMGVNLNKNILDNKLKFTARPFIGQSWHCFKNYWGGEIAMDIAQRDDGMPWGKISMGYIGGEDSLTDHGRGVDLHGDVDLTHHFKFTSGVRQNSSDGNSNYALLRWHLAFQ